MAIWAMWAFMVGGLAVVAVPVLVFAWDDSITGGQYPAPRRVPTYRAGERRGYLTDAYRYRPRPGALGDSVLFVRPDERYSRDEGKVA